MLETEWRRRFCRLLIPFFLLVVTTPVAGQQATLQGVVTDATTGQPLESASILLEQEGAAPRSTLADRNGFYLISGIPAGTYAARVSYLAHAPFEQMVTLEAGEERRLSVQLSPAAVEVEGIVAAAAGGAVSRELGRQRITPALIRLAPVPAASGDLATYLQTMPGVVATGDRGGQLFIRGGTHTENLSIVDGLMIYQPFHILGFFSAFPEDLISSVDFYAGGFGAR